ncbi:SigB/SigF/SigG family RNA polymerase sigma factor [Patulibacter minatonensis]|uniref:SigB/SigF/SigG family RNA polymerase sigma factor n=1 Tax=Patulibacter minatonensis TaxID=298163 RepID=UPI000687A97C|nr:SigB/SigF/SigG family RNA polymerase sigma factor [Patulibacter minatonensis]
MLHEATHREQIDLGLLRRYRETGDTFARDELATRCMPLVKSIARKYRGRGEELEDLIQAGTVGLVKAIDRFDPDAGHRFISFAAPNITGEIRRHFRDTTWAVHVPRAMQELDAKVQHTRRILTAASGEEPSDDDLANELHINVTDIEEAKSAGRAYRAVSLDAPVEDRPELLNTRGTIERGYQQVEAEATLAVAMEALDDRARRVLDLRFNHEMLQREIAEVIGVSQMQVSRIISDSIDRMHDYVAPDTPLAA